MEGFNSSPIELMDIKNKLDLLLQREETGTSIGILTNEQVCQLLAISSKTLKSYRDRGLISFSKVGKKIFYRKQDIDEFIQQFQQKRFKRFSRDYNREIKVQGISNEGGKNGMQ